MGRASTYAKIESIMSNVSSRRHRGFLVIWFKGSNEWADMYRTMDTIESEYMVYQTEKCPKTKRTHIQGYVHFKNGKTHKRVRKMFKGAKILVAGGSPEENRIYCTKVESRIPGEPFSERGTCPKKGKRSDLADMGQDIRDGLNDVDMFEKHLVTWHNYGRTLKEYRVGLIKPRHFWTVCLTLVGKTGVGKSSRAYWEAGQMGTVGSMLLPSSRSATVWADGCVGKDVIILEDFGGEINYRTFKRMLDWHPMTAAVKGSSCEWAPKYMVITTNVEPDQWYIDECAEPWTPEDNPICRRLTTNGSEIVHMTEVWIHPDRRENSDSDPDLDLFQDGGASATLPP